METWEVQIIDNVSLKGNCFTVDSDKVINILKELNIGTDSGTWIKGIKFEMKTMQELQVQLYGTSEGVSHVQVSMEDLKEIFHNNDTNFMF